MEAYLVVTIRLLTITALLLGVTLWVMGKRPIGELPVFSFLVLIIMGAVVGADIADPEIEHGPTAWAIIMLALIQFAVSRLTVSSRKAGHLLTFEPTVVVQDGEFLHLNMARVRYSLDEILTLLREAGVFDPSEVHLAVIEHNGRLSVLKKPETLPVTKQDLLLPPQQSKLAHALVVDGEVQDENLCRLGVTREQLEERLREMGLGLSDTFFAYQSAEGELKASRRGGSVEGKVHLRH